jgi:hypothetical protein
MGEIAQTKNATETKDRTAKTQHSSDQRGNGAPLHTRTEYQLINKKKIVAFVSKQAIAQPH